jgi:shikimate dehydrogenase
MSSDTPDRYALVGHPVSHSHSPVIHSLFAKQLGENMTYELIDATVEEFEVAVLGFKAAGGKGLNITVPHKERAFRLATSSGQEAEQAQAANTLTFSGGSIIANNTDGVGLVRDLTENLGVELQDKRVLILGAGGAARGVVCSLLNAGVMQLTIANRTLSRAQQLYDLLSKYGVFDICSFDELEEVGEQDVILNATSAGVRGEEVPFPDSLFTPNTFCYDLSYSLKDTPFVSLARKHGAGRAVQGWGMLIEQAAESFYIWRGVRPDTAPLLEKMMR